jgi:GT2 family glycosyltransferase
MVGNKKFTLVIADPGLEASSGHHAGVATYLALNRPRDISLIFFAHRTIEDHLYHKLKSTGCEIYRHFTTAQYRYYAKNDPQDKPPSLARIHSYIALLSKEYYALFEQLTARNEDERFVLCYHTLNWEHASALALALRRKRLFSGRLRHIALLMFNPAIDYRGQVTDALQCLNFRTAMNALQNCNGVELFVSDTELAQEYQQLLELPKPLPLHPCFLADWSRLPSLSLSSPSRATCITIYLGDAKPEKGFNKLPALVKALLARTDIKAELVIQYTFNGEDHSLKGTIAELHAIAAHDGRLTLHCGFWSDEQLHGTLGRTDLFIFTHDGDVYRDKNSGILWLLGWYQCPLLFLESSWLTREAGRLGLTFAVMNQETLSSDKIAEHVKSLLKKGAENASHSDMNERVQAYRYLIYYDFYEWIAAINDGRHMIKQIDFISTIFDPGFYLDRYPDIKQAGIPPFAHYLKLGGRELRSPHPLFDSDYYCSQTGPLSEGLTPLEHYLTEGWQKGFQPHPAFDSHRYLLLYPDIKESETPPLFHYLTSGAKEGRSAHLLFDHDFYQQQCDENHIDTSSANFNPLVHYLKTWEKTGFDPHPKFNSRYYLAGNKDIADAAVNPLYHFLSAGVFEQRSPNPQYPVGYMADNKRVFARELNPFVHWLEHSEETTVYSLEDYLEWRFKEHSFGWVFDDPRIKGKKIDKADFTFLIEEINHLVRKKESEWLLLDKSPDVSIIIPAYNQLIHTLGAIRSILINPSKFSYEIIIADDHSSDDTARVVQGINNSIIKLHTTKKQQGFLKNCNGAVQSACGDYLVLLNNDTITLPLWLDGLIDTFEDELNVGLVGSKLIYPDGKLQEAGGIIWQDGTGLNYGNGQALSHPKFNFLRDTDYCSGASIALPMKLWQQLDGFDPKYAPAYYEDTDLAFRVREAGYRVIYQPFSEVIHFEGVTHGKDIGTGLKKHQKINKRTFFNQWKDILKNHSAPAQCVYTFRHNSRGETIFVADACTPTPDRDSGSIDTMEYIKAFLRLGFHVVFTPQNSVYFENYTKDLQKLGVECLYAPYTNNICAGIEQLGGEISYAFLFRHEIANEAMGALKLYAPGAKIVFQTVDLHHLREAREAELMGDEAGVIAAKQTYQSELKAIAAADATIVLSEHERDYLLSKVPAGNIYQIPISRKEPDYSPKDFFERQNIMFIGGFRHPPNVDAMLWFCQHVWPRLKAKGFDGKLIIVGGDVPDEVEALASGSIV